MQNDGWVWPTNEDERLFLAKQNNDLGTYCAVLAALDVFVACRLDDAEAYLAGLRKEATRYAKTTDKRQTYLDVYTRGMLPSVRPENVYYDQTMWSGFVQDMAEWGGDWILAVNRGTPIEAFLSVRDVAGWLRANPQAVGTWNALKDSLRWVRSEAWEGELARALACGAHLSVMNGLPWNTMGHDRLDFQNERVTLRDWWGTDSFEDWRDNVDELLDTESLSGIDLVLALRQEGGNGSAPSADPEALVAGVLGWCQGRDVSPDLRAELLDVAEWVGRCEEWMRRDGLLPHGGVVATQAAWDLGRAIHMGRWGLTCGFADRQTAERIVRRAGELCLPLYASWTDLSAAYTLGRVIKMGRQGSPETTYKQSLHVHGILTSDPASPWRTLAMH